MGLKIEIEVNGQSDAKRQRQKEELVELQGNKTALLNHKTTILLGNSTSQTTDSDRAATTKSLRERAEELLRRHGETNRANPVMKALGWTGYFNGFFGLIPIVDRTVLKTTIRRGGVETTVAIWTNTAKDPNTAGSLRIKSYESGAFTLNLDQNGSGRFQEGKRVDALLERSPAYTSDAKQAYSRLIDLVEGCYSEVRPQGMENVLCVNNQPVGYRQLPHPYAE